MNKIVLISMVKNESDIIESFIRYHLNIVDEILISDHNSCDSTRSIIESIRDEGFPIHIFHENSAEHQQSKVMTNLMHKAVHEYKADVIIPLDADEFIAPVEADHDIKSILHDLNIDTVYNINSTIYFPCDSANNNDSFFPWRLFYKSNSHQGKGKIIIGREIPEKHHASIEQGNHDISISKRKRKHVKYFEHEQIQIVHIPFRSYQQFLSKISVGWVSNTARYNKKFLDAYHWRDAFTKIKQGKILKDSDIYKIISSIDFDKNTMKIDSFKSKCPYCVIKYDDRVLTDPFLNILHVSESLATQYSKLNFEHNKFSNLLKKMLSVSLYNLKYFLYKKVMGRNVTFN